MPSASEKLITAGGVGAAAAGVGLHSAACAVTRPVKNAGLSVAAAASPDHAVESNGGAFSRAFGDNGVAPADAPDEYDPSDRPMSGAEDVVRTVRSGDLSPVRGVTARAGATLAAAGEAGERVASTAIAGAFLGATLSELGLEAIGVETSEEVSVRTKGGPFDGVTGVGEAVSATVEAVSNTLRTGDLAADVSPAPDTRSSDLEVEAAGEPATPLEPDRGVEPTGTRPAASVESPDRETELDGGRGR